MKVIKGLIIGVAVLFILILVIANVMPHDAVNATPAATAATVQTNPLDTSTAVGQVNLKSCEKMPDQWHLPQACLILEAQECLRLRSNGVTHTRDIDCR